MFPSDDLDRDIERHLNAMDILLERRPKCNCCGKHIQDNEALHYTAREFEIWLCLNCVDENTEYIEVD